MENSSRKENMEIAKQVVEKCTAVPAFILDGKLWILTEVFSKDTYDMANSICQMLTPLSKIAKEDQYEGKTQTLIYEDEPEATLMYIGDVEFPEKYGPIKVVRKIKPEKEDIQDVRGNQPDGKD